MNRKASLAIAVLWAASLGARAQVVAPAGGAPLLARPCKSCCSIWDFMGVGQIGRFVDQNIVKSSLGQAVATVLAPVGRALGLGPSLLSDKFAKGGGAMALANKLKKEEKQAPLKIKAIRYLGTLDCTCNPEIVVALLASLDDCTEEVRYEALKALHGDDAGGKKKCKKCSGKHGVDPDCASGDCNGCQCQEVVMRKLNSRLLARDENGCLLEKSGRVRALAMQMIEECLSRREPPPDIDEVVVEPAPVPKTRIDTKPEIKIDRRPELRIDRPTAPVPPPPSTPELRPTPGSSGSSVPKKTKGATAFSSAAKTHTVAKVPVAASTAGGDVKAEPTKTVETSIGARADADQPARSTRGTPIDGQRHVWGELFGY